MKLAPRRSKDYVWPHNPRVYTIEYHRDMAVQKFPMGVYHLQDLGLANRVMEGEGEFVGEGAYSQFGQLANVFYDSGPGLLVHPLWQTASAYFVELRLEQEPRPDYVRYSFAFWEASGLYSGAVQEVTRTGEAASGGNGGVLSHTVEQGDTLWAISARYGVGMTELLARNRQIRNPNLILPGEKVTVR